MAVSKCQIVGKIVLPTGEDVAISRVDFSCADVIPMPPLMIIPELSFVITNEDGEIDVSLYPGSYSVRISRGTSRKYPTINIVVPNALNARLSDIQNMPEPINLDVAQLAVQATNLARDQAVQPAVDAQAIGERIDLGELDAAVAKTGAHRVQTGLDHNSAETAATPARPKHSSRTPLRTPQPPLPPLLPLRPTWRPHRPGFSHSSSNHHLYEGRRGV